MGLTKVLLLGQHLWPYWLTLLCLLLILAIWNISKQKSTRDHVNLVLPEYKGFEDMAQFENGGFLSFASNHSHFKFVVGTSMRDMLKAKVIFW